MTTDALTRRKFMTVAGTACAVAAAATTVPGLAFAAKGAEPFPMPPLPYAQNSLEPVISARTVSFHFGKHTAGYYKRMNKALSQQGNVPKRLEDVFLAAHRTDQKLFNNAAQSWNHTFYWNQFTAGRRDFGGPAAEAITATFGGYQAFKDQMVKAAGEQFASGWVWLVRTGGQLRVTKTSNADNPLTMGQTPLLVVDVWEHAYYLDYQNRRKDHVGDVLDKLVDWDVVAARMK